MVFITEDLIRKRAEHNEMLLSTLEEVSLHQQEIEKIEHIDKWCRELKILYLQSNLIPKIENLSHLKKLEYVNLALNNIEEIEGLEKCECLKKLDLTVNFIGKISSVKTLTNNVFLEEMYLTGNPCAQFEGYRDYVIASLPQLKFLDGTAIEKSERITAQQNYRFIEASISEQERAYLEKRAIEREEGLREIEENATIEEITDEEFWNKPSKHTPEARYEIQKKIEKQNDEKNNKRGNRLDELEKKEPRRTFDDRGKPLNINEAKIDFHFEEDEEEQCYKLDIPVYKHMDTSLLDCDVQPSYVRVTLKGKIFQLTLWKEVNCDASTAKRSQISGNLLITMPFANPIIKKSKSKKETATRTTDSEMTSNPVNSDNQCNNKENETQFLEVDSSSAKLVDLNVVDQNEKVSRKNAPYKPKSSAIYSGVVEKDSKVIDLPDDLPPLDDFGF
ncbi:dynein axonemal assembly factor 11-like [Convolutriloba macropyga]|uniref:dynein axonemal assembly factor 11-like n=1 Tax=Convolutriloba macropyga TaxID=536237 RepID=UPI003F51B3FF